jgi:hypothetical protein
MNLIVLLMTISSKMKKNDNALKISNNNKNANNDKNILAC